MRRAAAKGSAKVTACARGAVATVTATETDSAGNLWGKTSDGWFAVRYQGSTYAAKA